MIRALGLLTILAGCAPTDVSNVAPAEDPVLLTELFLDARSIEPQLAKDFACVGIENAGWEEDPPRSVIDGLRARLGVPVVPQSQCRRDEETSLVVSEGATGSGIWLTVGRIDCASARRCSATVSYYVANQGAGGRDLMLERTRGGWRLTPTGRSWIS